MISTFLMCFAGGNKWRRGMKLKAVKIALMFLKTCLLDWQVPQTFTFSFKQGPSVAQFCAVQGVVWVICPLSVPFFSFFFHTFFIKIPSCSSPFYLRSGQMSDITLQLLSLHALPSHFSFFVNILLFPLFLLSCVLPLPTHHLSSVNHSISISLRGKSSSLLLTSPGINVKDRFWAANNG